MKSRISTYSLAEMAFFVALIIVLTVVPFLGYIPLGPINATTVHIPVIIGAIVFGWKKGAFLGGVFGLTSIIKNTMTPNASSFVFTPFIPVMGSDSGSLWALVVALIPRICIGLVGALVFSFFVNKSKKWQVFGCALSGFLGSLTNTVLVMGGIYLFFGESYAAVRGVAYEALLSTISAIVTGSGMVEAVVAAVLCALIGTAILSYKKRSTPTEKQ